MGSTKKRPAPTSRPKQAERDPHELLVFVEELKRQWMATIDAMVDPLMIVDKSYRIAKANRAMAEHAGRPVRDILGKKCHEVFAGSKSPCRNCTMPLAVRTGKPQTWTLDGISGDRHFEVSSQPIFDASGKMDGIVQVYRDRTAAKRFEQQLQHNEKLASIGLLAGGVAHEINNPLGGILIFSQMLLREMDKASPHYQDVVEIEAATKRCKAIVESLLDFARQRPAKQTTTEAIDPREAARTALRFSKVGWKGKSIDVVEDWDARPATVLGDHNKLIQVFLNLIQNAVQAMPDGGTLTLASRVRAGSGGGEIDVRISDTGVGIPPANLKKIFDPFFTTKDPGEGTGLGLAICHGIIQDLSGELTVESRVGRGTSFQVRLPCNRELTTASKPRSKALATSGKPAKPARGKG